MVLLRGQEACLQKRAPRHQRSQQLCTWCLSQLRSACFWQANALPMAFFPCSVGLVLTHGRCSEMNSISTQELFQYSAIRGYNCREGGKEFMLRAVILLYCLAVSTSKYYRLVFQHFLSQGCVGSAWSPEYNSLFFLAWDERAPLETLFTCLICILSLSNSLSSIVLVFIGFFWWMNEFCSPRGIFVWPLGSLNASGSDETWASLQSRPKCLSSGF